jgi:hypothetical protein
MTITITPEKEAEIQGSVDRINQSIAGVEKERGVDLSELRYSRMTGQPMSSSSTPTPPAPSFTPTRSVAAATPSYESEFNNARTAELRRQEAEIGRIENVYKEDLARATAEEQKAGERDMARSNTIAAMTGMMGGAEATTRLGAADRRTDERIQARDKVLRAEKAASLGALFGRIDQNAARAAEIELQTKREDQDRMRKETATAAYNNLLSFAKNKASWNDFTAAYESEPSLRDEVTRAGISLGDLKKDYDLLYGSDPDNPDIQGFGTQMQNGQLIYHYFDNKTGKVVAGTYDLGLPKEAGSQYTNSQFDRESGQVIMWDKNGNAKAVQVGQGSLNSTLTPLLGAGFSQDEAKSIDADVRQYGLDTVISGMDKAQADAVRNVYKTTDTAETSKLTRESISTLFGISDDDQKSGFLGFGKTNKERLDEIMSTIERYQGVGYKDDEILKMMEEE